MRSITLEGAGLHSGTQSRVRLVARPGAVTMRVGDVEAMLSGLRVLDTARATTLGAPGDAFRVRTVEHLFGALAGMGVHDGVCIEVYGDEVPLLDGAALTWCEALASLGVSASRPRLAVACEAVIEIGESRFTFAPSTNGSLSVTAHIQFSDVRLALDARWDGGVADFVARVAPARTFAFAREVESLLESGLAKFASRESVVVIGDDIIHAAGRPFMADEPVRHKLLDLVGDMYLYGGPPVGHVNAFRPGHRATHQAMAQAIERGVVVERVP
jgi:UDP-3-O-[3-hydroxymyristoyl] N-acetylglucosamine deacetylase